MAVPQFHRPAIASFGGHGESLIIAVGVELIDPVDMAAKAVEVIEAVILHRPKPPASRNLSLSRDSTKDLSHPRLRKNRKCLFLNAFSNF